MMPHFIKRLTLAGITSLLLLTSGRAQENLQETLINLLPQKGELAGWRQTYEPRFFTPDDLYEYINGAADLYLQYGFQMVLTTDYAVGVDSNGVTVEVYTMASPLHAFGMYAAERSPSEPAIAIGVEGYHSANVLNFYKGPYYVKLTSFTLDREMGSVLAEMAQFIAERIQGHFTAPEILALFPQQDAVLYSDRYVPSDFYGQSYFQNGYRRDYRNDACGNFQLFLIPFSDTLEARSAFAKYSDFLLQQKDPQDVKAAGGDLRLALHSSEGDVVVFCQGSMIGGALGGSCPEILQTRVYRWAETLYPSAPSPY
ncbi:hypothetical protein GX408_13785 [bacterium]|nr:hypothetical protein [bacterium]